MNKIRIGELELPVSVDKAIETILTDGIDTQIVLKPITSEYDVDLPFYANLTFYFRLIQPSSVKVIKLH